MAALETLRTLEREQRPATAGEQQVLARWGAWGAQGVWQIFDEGREQYAEDRARLHELLGDDEYNAARRTTVNAHYTNPAYIREVWSTLDGLGFTGGEVLEPGCGVGSFIGLAPGSAHLTGVELDPTTAAIAQALYPHADIRSESFADTRFPSDRFDAVVGNVPFADVVLHDPRYNPARHSMHNHFILKSLDMTRPGGVVGVLTSRYTMDAQNSAARRDIAARADMVGAVRLPSGAHARTAGTSAVTDLLILRRREDGHATTGFDQWEHVRTATFPGPSGNDEQIPVNDYFAIHHPERMLGEARIDIGMYGAPGLEIIAADLSATPQRLHDVLAGIRQEAHQAGQTWLPREQVNIANPSHVTARAALADEREGFIVPQGDGTFTQVLDGVHEPFDVPKTQASELRTLLSLRDQARALISEEARQADDTPQMDAARERLAQTWRDCTEQYGPINRFTITHGTRTVTVRGGAVDDLADAIDGANVEGITRDATSNTITVPTTSRRVPPVMHKLRQDPYSSLVMALEVFDPDTQQAKPAGLLRTRQVTPRHTISGTDSPSEALAVTLDRTGRVDLNMIAELLDTTPEQARANLGDAIFEVPSALGEDTGDEPRYVTRAEYLSGNVRTTLDEARAAANDDPQRWQRNVEALRPVIPADLGPGDISAKIGAVWIPPGDHTAFMREVLEDRNARVINAGGSNWEVQNADRWSVNARNIWGTERMPASEIMGKVLRQEAITVMDSIGAGDDKKTVLNKTETAAAQEKVAALQEKFSEWVWQDPERGARLLDDYNRRFNAVKLRDYTQEGQDLTLPGLVKNFTPRAHQLSAVARMINEPSVGLCHEVGAGKTAEMIIGTMELGRLGMVNKPAIVVPNHMLEQFSRDCLQLYPQADILAAGSNDLTKDKRSQFVARAATNDWDAVILTRGAFRSLGLSHENQAAYMERELATARTALEAAKEDSGGQTNRTLKGIEKALERREEDIKKLLENPGADRGLTFEETGIDYLCIDELHDFKNLTTVSSIPGAGISGSRRAQDLDMKLDWLRHQHGERVVTGATATPIANSVTEMYVLQRYLRPERLTETGITDFDSWAATFGEVVQGFETNVTGDKFQLKARFARFQNTPELLTMFHEFADVKLAEDLNLPTPAIAPREDGQSVPRLITVSQTEALADYIEDLSRRVDNIQSGSVDPTDDNMLKVSSDGRAAALDMHLVTAGDEWDLLTGPTKVEAAAREITRVWAQTADNEYIAPDTGEVSPIKGSLQIVFCDLSTPNPDRWNVYDALRDELYEGGLPAGSVRFIQEAKNDAEKARLFAAARAGKVSVLVGSTATMGTGTNVQDRVVHMVDMDAPWRPADVTQRHGRGIRQGNENPEVLMTQLVTEGSFDTYMWQTLERKSRFINQIMRGGSPGSREIEDIGGADTLTFSEFKALASGNPLLLEQAQASDELARFRRLRTSYDRNERSMSQTVARSERGIAALQQRRPQVEAAVALIKSTVGDDFGMAWQGQRFNKRTHAAHSIEAWIAHERIRPYDRRDYGVVAQISGQNVTLAVGNESLRWGIEGLEDPHLREAIMDLHEPKLGLITKLENLTQKSLPAQINRMNNTEADLERRLDQARASIGVPFKYADELRAAEARYADIERRISDSHQQNELGQESGREGAPQSAREQNPPARLQDLAQRLNAEGAEGRTPAKDMVGESLQRIRASLQEKADKARLPNTARTAAAFEPVPTREQGLALRR